MPIRKGGFFMWKMSSLVMVTAMSLLLVGCNNDKDLNEETPMEDLQDNLNRDNNNNINSTTDRLDGDTTDNNEGTPGTDNQVIDPNGNNDGVVEDRFIDKDNNNNDNDTLVNPNDVDNNDTPQVNDNHVDTNSTNRTNGMTNND